MSKNAKADELRLVMQQSEKEMAEARRLLSEAQSRFAQAKKKYERDLDAWLAEMEG
jgi:NACalpha-BTF3-like transcription factor